MRCFTEACTEQNSWYNRENGACGVSVRSFVWKPAAPTILEERSPDSPIENVHVVLLKLTDQDKSFTVALFPGEARFRLEAWLVRCVVSGEGLPMWLCVSRKPRFEHGALPTIMSLHALSGMWRGVEYRSFVIKCGGRGVWMLKFTVGVWIKIFYGNCENSNKRSYNSSLVIPCVFLIHFTFVRAKPSTPSLFKLSSFWDILRCGERSRRQKAIHMTGRCLFGGKRGRTPDTMWRRSYSIFTRAFQSRSEVSRVGYGWYQHKRKQVCILAVLGHMGLKSLWA